MIKPFEHGGNIYQVKRNCETVVADFSANINPLGLNTAIKQAIIDSVDKIIHYPDPEAHDLRSAIAEYYGVKPKYLALGNGAAELIYLYTQVCKKKRVLLLVPCFSEYQRASLAANLEIEFLYLQEQENFNIDYQKVAEKIPENGIIFLANPNNPTGNLLNLVKLEELLILAEQKHSDILVDESFIDFVATEQYSCSDLVNKYPNLAIIHSLTKIFALPGLRLGFGLFNPKIVEQIDKAKDVWNVNSLAQRAGVVALQQEEYVIETREQVAQLRTEFFHALQKFKMLKVYPSTVNFLLIQLVDWLDAGEFVAKMRKKGIMIRDCSNYPGLNSKFVRIAVRTAIENRLFLDKLQELLQELEGEK